MRYKYKVRIYKVQNRLLTQASKLMNHNAGDRVSDSYIENIIIGEESSLLIVKTTDDYPYIENKWEKIIDD